jgi:hypothetical protein
MQILHRIQVRQPNVAAARDFVGRAVFGTRGVFLSKVGVVGTTDPPQGVGSGRIGDGRDNLLATAAAQILAFAVHIMLHIGRLQARFVVGEFNGGTASDEFLFVVMVCNNKKLKDKRKRA